MIDVTPNPSQTRGETNEKTISSTIAYYINTIFHNPTGRRQRGCGLGAIPVYDRV